VSLPNEAALRRAVEHFKPLATAPSNCLRVHVSGTAAVQEVQQQKQAAAEAREVERAAGTQEHELD
jgi:hypothetical protein